LLTWLLSILEFAQNAWPPWLWRRQQIRDHTVKDQPILRYKAKTDLISKSAKIGSTLSLEEHQSCIRLVCLSQDGQNNSLPVLVNKIPTFLFILGSTGRRPVGFGCQPKRAFAKYWSRTCTDYQ